MVMSRRIASTLNILLLLTIIKYYFQSLFRPVLVLSEKLRIVKIDIPKVSTAKVSILDISQILLFNCGDIA